MQKTDLLKKFLDNRCNEEEARLAMQYLETEPWLLDELVPKSEWDESDAGLMNPLVEAEMRRRVFSKTKSPVIRIFKPALSYAALLSAVAIGLLFLFQSNRNEAGKTALASPPPLISPAKHAIHNTTTSTQTFTLSDNSTLIVYPGSSVEYDVDFSSRRSITLQGKATFHVAKHEGSPFIVYAGDISTTALGTHFLVDNSTDANTVNVRLFEGRVVVQAVKETLSVARTYLEAGQQCFVNISSRLVKVESLYKPGKPAKPVQPEVMAVQMDKRLQFSKTPLPEVLSKLQYVFNQQIQVNAADIEGKYFTGSFSPADSLATVLNVIADMNDLKYELNGQAIELVKVVRSNMQLATGNKVTAVQSPGIITDHKKRVIASISAPPPVVPQNITRRETQPEIVIDEYETRYTAVALPEFLMMLEKQTKRKIRFNEAELQNINFTGSIPMQQSVRSILTAICNSNGLTLTINKGTFYISKTQSKESKELTE